MTVDDTTLERMVRAHDAEVAKFACFVFDAVWARLPEPPEGV